MVIFSEFDRVGTFVTASPDLTTPKLDVSKFTSLQVTAFSNVNMILTINWGIDQLYDEYTDSITITAGDTISKNLRTKSKYMSVTYYNTDVNYTTRSTFIFS